ncbi:MAG: single-stranded DNA-binding protein [Clostridia bacterium]|nr:single-stranded DNA-binding protein [Clostridia bacterium]
MNKAILIGNLTRTPESGSTHAGATWCRFTIAVSRPYTDQDGQRPADFLNIVTWRGLAENCARYLDKGRKVAVEGRIETRQYDDQDGQRRYVTEIVADNVEFLSTPER